MSKSDSRFWLISPNFTVLIALSVLALCTRSLPYSLSILPFNNDGITEARIAADILTTSHLIFPADSYYADTYSVLTPAYNTMLAFASATIGIDTYTLSQSLVAVLSVLTVVGGYAIALRISRDVKGALSAAFVLALLGTFVFLSGSAWKGSLGIAVLILLTFAYMNRSEKRYLILELMVLASLPFVYHLVTVLACLMLAYLTLWSVLVASLNRRINTSHVIDIAIICGVSLGAYVYYILTHHSRLTDYDSAGTMSLILLLFMGLFLAAGFMLRREKSLSFSVAPAAGTIVATIIFIDHYNPVFPYVQGYSSYVIVLGLAYGLVVAFGWYGLELLVRSNSRYRAIPLGLLLPVLTLLALALISGSGLEGHKIFYRTFDYADVALAIGVGTALASFSRTKFRNVFMAVLVFVLLCSFPFSYATAALLGDRHDSQEYEIDAITWIRRTVDQSTPLRSDERLAYNARALFDFGKDPYLPSRFMSEDPSEPNVMNLLLEEWTSIGVNDYPRGHPVLDGEYVSFILSFSNVIYMGGPESNNVIVFQTTEMV